MLQSQLYAAEASWYWVKKLGVWAQNDAIFRQTAANYPQCRLWVLQTSILSLNPPASEGFPAPKFVFWRNIFRPEENFPIS